MSNAHFFKLFNPRDLEKENKEPKTEPLGLSCRVEMKSGDKKYRKTL